MIDQDKILVGKILGPHGVRGQVKLGSFTDDPEAIFDYEPVTDEAGSRVFALTARGAGKDHFLASIKGVSTREEAQALKGTKLYVERAALPKAKKNEYYHADLIGLTAQDAQGQLVGLVENVHDYGAGAFLEIKPANAKSFMLPFKNEFVPLVDIQGGIIQVLIPEGWLSEEKQKIRHSGQADRAEPETREPESRLVCSGEKNKRDSGSSPCRRKRQQASSGMTEGEKKT